MLSSLIFFLDRSTGSFLLLFVTMDKNDPNVQDDNRQPMGKRYHNRRKYGAHGIKPVKIEKLSNKRNQKHKNDRRNHYIRHVAGKYDSEITLLNEVSDQSINLASKQMTTKSTHLNKRKRDISLQELQSNTRMLKSTSSISIVPQPLRKKMKKKKRSTTVMLPVIQENNNWINKNYRFVSLFL
jgi:hypothetical protein